MAHKLDLNLLRILATAYECKLVTRTAEHFDVTQSAISNALNRLKFHVGQELFDPVTSTRQFVVYCHEAILHPLRKKLDLVLKDDSISVSLLELSTNEQKLYDDLTDEKADLVIYATVPEGALSFRIIHKGTPNLRYPPKPPSFNT